MASRNRTNLDLDNLSNLQQVHGISVIPEFLWLLSPKKVKESCFSSDVNGFQVQILLKTYCLHMGMGNLFKRYFRLLSQGHVHTVPDRFLLRFKSCSGTV